MYPVEIKKAKAYTKKIIGGIVASVSFDTKSKKEKGESGVELRWYKNRDLYQVSQP